VQSSIVENIQVKKQKYLFTAGHYMENICQEHQWINVLPTIAGGL